MYYKVLLIEQFCGGHYDNYLRALLPALGRVANEVVVATTPKVVEQSPVLRNAFLADQAQLVVWPGLPDVSSDLTVKDQLGAALGVVTAIREHRPDYTLITSADPHARGFAAAALAGLQPLRDVGPIDVVYHCGYGPHGGTTKQWAKRLLYERVQRDCGFGRPAFVNFFHYEGLIERKVFQPEEIRIVSDPVEQPALIGREAACHMLSLDPEVFHLGLLGSLDNRKAVPDLLATFRAADLGPKYRLVLGGCLAPEFQELIAHDYDDLMREGRLVVLDRFLSEEELTHGYEALDLCTPLYRCFPGLASLALHALAARRPILVDDFGWMGALVRRFQVGASVRLGDLSACVQGMYAAIEAAQKPLPEEPVRRLMTFHKPENFAAHMMSGIWRHAGLEPDMIPVEWSWVKESLPR